MITINYYSNNPPNGQLIQTLKDYTFKVRLDTQIDRDILNTSPKFQWFLYDLTKTLDHIYTFHPSVPIEELATWGAGMFLIYPYPSELKDYPDLKKIFGAKRAYSSANQFIKNEFTW